MLLLMHGPSREDAPMSLGQALAAEIDRRGISQRAAADLIGVRYQNLSQWIAGKYRPKSEYLAPIARFLHLPVKEVKALRAQSVVDPAKRLEAIEADLAELKDMVLDLARRRQR
jgi:transcriptional regulator with XRE-family HTH domain